MKNVATNRLAPDLLRRTVIRGTLALSLGVLLSGTALAASTTTAATRTGDVTMQDVEFKNNGIRMAGNVYLPKGFNQAGRYPMVIMIHPGGGVNEQTAGLYARKRSGSCRRRWHTPTSRRIKNPSRHPGS